jgi:3-oxoacyl-[acyl-carrier-protein] synthase III
MRTAGIFGVGAALPEHVVTNADFATRLDTTDAWIVKRTGIRERRYLNGALSLAQLGTAACAEALADAGLEPGEVDQIIVTTITPDLVTPGLAPAIAAELGAERAGAVDLNAACAGFIYGLDQAAALVESGRARVVLVCAAEALSRLTDFDDRSTAVLFGDGAGAVVIGAGDLPLGLPPFELRCDGVHADMLYADTEERVLRMNGREVYRHAVARMVESMTTALERAGMGVADLDLFVAHQANARIVEQAALELGMPRERVFLNVDLMANTSSASIPIALWQAEREGLLQPGARVGLAAFGAGFVWGAGIVSWKEPARVTA